MADSMREEIPMQLSMVAPGQDVQFVGVHGGWGIRRRLAEMGLNPGVKMKVIQADFQGGPIIVAVRDSRLALGRRMAHKIMVNTI